MLYDGAIRFMEAGKHAMQSGDIYVQNENVQKAQRIIAELMATLDMEQGGRSQATSRPSIRTFTAGSWRRTWKTGPSS